MFNLRVTSLALLFILFGNVLLAQNGSMDSSFNPKAFHKFLIPYGSTPITVNKVLVQPDNSVILGGYFRSTGVLKESICRIKADKTLDTNFLAGVSINGTITNMALQADGKIIVCGNFSSFDGVAANDVIRLLPNGIVDPSFNLGVGATYNGSASGQLVRSIEIQSDGKILLGGQFNAYDGVSRQRIVRLLPSGLVDLTFNTSTATFNYVDPNSSIYDTQILPDGRIVAVGSFTIQAGTPSVTYNSIICLNPNGTVDLNFDNFYLPYSYSIELQGNALITGPDSYGLVRLNFLGIEDATFNVPFFGNGAISDIHVRNDNSIFIVQAARIVKLGVNGNFLYEADLTDPSISSSGPNGAIKTIDENQSGLIYGGSFNSSASNYNINNGIGYLDFNGTIHKAINGLGVRLTAGFSTSPVGSPMIKVQNDGKIVVGGKFSHYNNVSSNSMFRTNEDGFLDTSFNIGTGFNNHVEAFEILDDGSMIVIGDFTSFNGMTASKIAKISSSGALVQSFFSGVSIICAPSVSTSYSRNKIMKLNNGGLLCNIFEYSDLSPSINRKRLQLLNLDGSVNPILNVPTTIGVLDRISGNISAFDVQNDSLIVIGGTFIQYGTDTLYNLSRLNMNGSRDTTFLITNGITLTGAPTSDVWVSDVIVQPDGKILIAGKFNKVDNSTMNGLARLNFDGSIDSTFDIGTGLDNLSSSNSIRGWDLVLMPDGKILVSGIFVSYNGQPVGNLFRLNADGSLDTSFVPPYIPFQSNAAFQSDGKIIVGSEPINQTGGFDYLSGTSLIRLENDNFIPEVQLSFANSLAADCSAAGEVIVNSTYGIPPYLYSWDGMPFSANQIYTYTDEGFYTATVMDSLNNSDVGVVYLQAPLDSASYDLTANLIVGSFRPGFDTYITVDGLNKTCVPTDGSISMVLPNGLTVNSVAPPANQISGDTLTWNFTALTYDSSSFIIDLNVGVSTSYQIGDSVFIDLMIDPLVADVDTLDNIRNYWFPIINGYDPNDKKVYPTGECIPNYIDTNELLTYTVRFQNTGNSEAINITVLDTLSDLLDLSSFRVVSKSHPVQVELIDTRTILFNFDSILLPDSLSDPLGSIGYIIFESRPNSGLMNNEVIENSASIYFDFNPPIFTNTVLNTISDGFHSSSEFSISLGECDSLNWNGVSYSSSGMYQQSLQNIYGCDSLVTLNLTVHQSVGVVDFQESCDAFTWIDGNTYTSDNNTATVNLITTNGCDSLVTLNLTVHQSTSGVDFQEACNSFTWIDGNTYTSDNNTATANLFSIYGCDSIVTLDLTINSLDVSTSQSSDGITISANNANASYQWIDCGNGNSPIIGQTGQNFTTNVNGDFAVVVTENNCSDTSACQTVNSVGIVEVNPSDQIRVYPNPNNGNFFVDLGDEFTLIRISVLDLNGKVLRTEEFVESSLVNFKVSVPSGYYILSIQADENVSIVPLSIN